MSFFASNAAVKLFEVRLLLSNCLLVICEVNFRTSNLFGSLSIILWYSEYKNFFFLCLLQIAEVFVQRLTFLISSACFRCDRWSLLFK